MLIAIFLSPVGLGLSPATSNLNEQHANQFASAATTSTQSGPGLTLTNALPILPADGGSYSTIVAEFKNLKSNAPIIPPSNITVEFSSSNLQIGTVPLLMTFPAGSFYVAVPFQTTTTPGVTNITAIANGYQPTSILVKTQKTGGLPTALQVIVSPAQVPPDSKQKASVTVEPVDAFGNPVKLASNLTVTLSSSSAQVGSIPGSVTIQPGQSFAETSFTPSYIAGQTAITASAAGLSSGSAILTTVGPIARRLVVSVAPVLISSTTGETALVSVELQDNNSQTPAPAPSTVSVVLTSDNTSVAVLPNPPLIVIPAGQSYASITLSSGGDNGIANITASAQGYVKGSALVIAKSPSDTPSQLGVYFSPGTLLPDNSTYPDAVVTQMISGSCYPALSEASQSLSSALSVYRSGSCAPATSSSSISVYTRSSNNASMQVDSTPAIIPAGLTHTDVKISTTYLPGSAVITAQSVGLSSITSTISSIGLSPDALAISFSPKSLISDGNSYNTIYVSLIDSRTRSPARAPVDTLVSLGSNTSVPGNVQPTLVIKAGQTFAQASFNTSGIAGVALITATSSNYTSAEGTLSLVTPAASELGLYSSPSEVLANGGDYRNLFVQLQDSSGNPQKTDVPVVVQLTNPFASYGRVQSNVTIEPGSTFAVATLDTTNSAGLMSINAFANGYRTGQVTVQSELLPISGYLVISLTDVPKNTQTRVTVSANSFGVPIQNATVKWIQLGGGSIVSGGSTTGNDGLLNTVYRAGSKVSQVVLQAEILKAGYIPTVVSQNLNITAGSDAPFLMSKIFWFPVWSIILVVGVVASIVGIRVYRARRVSRRDEDFY